MKVINIADSKQCLKICGQNKVMPIGHLLIRTILIEMCSKQNIF